MNTTNDRYNDAITNLRNIINQNFDNKEYAEKKRNANSVIDSMLSRLKYYTERIQILDSPSISNEDERDLVSHPDWRSLLATIRADDTLYTEGFGPAIMTKLSAENQEAIKQPLNIINAILKELHESMYDKLLARLNTIETQKLRDDEEASSSDGPQFAP